MRSVGEFLDHVLDKRRAAEACGLKLDVMVLHAEFHDMLMNALVASPSTQSSWELRQCPKDEDRKDLYLHGVKVMWSPDRLPARHTWFRYSNPKYKKKA